MASTSCSRTTSSLLNLRRLRPSSSSPCRQPPGLRAPPGTPVHGATSLAASVTFTPPLHRRSMSSNTTKANGALMDEPKREARFGLSLVHSALKLKKSAISKVQKSIICIFKNGKKQFLHQKKV